MRNDNRFHGYYKKREEGKIFKYTGKVNNDIYSTVYATNFINYTTCFPPNGPSSGVSLYTLSTY
jgi:hypothetical protein